MTSRFNLTAPSPEDVARRRDMRTLDRARDLRHLLDTLTESGAFSGWDDVPDHVEALVDWAKAREAHISELWDDAA